MDAGCRSRSERLVGNREPDQSGSNPMHTVVFSDGRVGGTEALSAAELARSPRTDPFRGGSSLSQDASAESLRGFIPSAGELRGLEPLVLGAPGAETIIDVDTRMRVADTRRYPAKATALITFDGGWCTGWFYRPNVVATAGHCVHTGGDDRSLETQCARLAGL